MFKFAIAAAIPPGAAVVVLVSALGAATPARAASYSKPGGLELWAY
jgi:hypothetical protein